MMIMIVPNPKIKTTSDEDTPDEVTSDENYETIQLIIILMHYLLVLV